MSSPADRRLEPRFPSNARGIVVAPGLELPCLIVDRSASGLRLRLNRGLALPRAVTVVDIAAGLALDAEVAWSKGVEAGIKVRGQAKLRGLVPARVTQARDAWLRAGGR